MGKNKREWQVDYMWTKSLGVTIFTTRFLKPSIFFTQKKKPVSENDQ